MTHRYLASIMSLPMLLFSSSFAQTPTEVFLLIGQSNMAGRAEMLPADADPMPGVLLLNEKSEWEPAHQPLNRYATDRKELDLQRFNLGGPFAEALHQADDACVPGLIVNARGNTAIELWLPGADLYEHALQRVRELDGVKLAGVLWHQGESNSKDEAYGQKLEQLITSLREALNQPDLPFIVGHISGENVINDQMDALAEKLPLVGVVTADGLNRFDGTHYDRDGLITLGRRYAQAYEHVIEQNKEDTNANE